MIYKRSNKYTVVTTTTFLTTVYPGKNIANEYATLTEAGLLTVNRGFQFDGATAIIDRRRVMRAALVHDSIYHIIRLGYFPDTDKAQAMADANFLAMCLEDGVPRWRARLYYRALQRFGHRSLLKQEKRMFINSSDG